MFIINPSGNQRVMKIESKIIFKMLAMNDKSFQNVLGGNSLFLEREVPQKTRNLGSWAWIKEEF